MLIAILVRLRTKDLIIMKFSVVDSAFLAIIVSTLCSANPIPNDPEAISQTVSQITNVTTAVASSLVIAPKYERRKGGGGRSSSSSTSSGRGTTSAPKSTTPKVSSSNGGRPIISTSTGSRYTGGGSSPYAVGKTAPTRSGMGVPVLVPVYGYYPGFWYYPYPLWYYPYNDPWQFQNQTTNVNETIKVICVAQQYQESTCDAVTDPGFVSIIMGNGAWNGWNNTMATVQFINNTKTVVLNGTTANGTDVVTSWGVSSAPVPSAFLAMAGMAMMAFMSL